MKRNFKSQEIASQFKLVELSLIIAVAISWSFAFKANIGDLWKQLGIDQQSANVNIRESFLRGYLKSYGVGNIKNIATGDKVGVTKNLLDYTKQYISTQFKAVYEKERALSMPHEPELKPLRTKEAIQKEEIDKLEQNIKKTETDMKTMNDDMKKVFGPGIVESKKRLAEYKKPGYELFDLMAQGEKMNREREITNYHLAMKDWEIKYPADFRLVIKDRLQKLLEVTKDVDFNAELKDQNGKKKFVNPVYEAKRPEWKMAFRAGADVTGLTRAFALQWLEELK